MKRRNLVLVIILMLLSNVIFIFSREIYLNLNFDLLNRPDANKGKIIIQDIINARPEKAGGDDDRVLYEFENSKMFSNESVLKVIKNALSESLISAGYEVVSKESSGNNYPKLRIEVKDFICLGNAYFGLNSTLLVKLISPDDKVVLFEKEINTYSAMKELFMDYEDAFERTFCQLLNKMIFDMYEIFDSEVFYKSYNGEKFIDDLEVVKDFENKQSEKMPEEVMKLENLRGLSLYNNLLDYVDGFDNFNKLEFLDVSYNTIKEFRKMDKLENLISLSVSGSNIKEFKNLEGLKNLRYLDLNYNGINKFKNLDNLKSLKYLLLYLNNIKKIEGLDSLENLKWLNLSKNSINSLKNINKLKSLMCLDLGDNKIGKIEDLNDLKNLARLNLYDNSVRKIEGLDNQINLIDLNLGKNSIKKIENLNNLKKLIKLNLAENDIKKLENLNELKELRILNITDSNISKLENLENLKNLENIFISEKQIRVISASTLDHLKKVGTKINKIEVERWLKKENIKIK